MILNMITLITQRNRPFHQSLWMITTVTLKELYQHFISYSKYFFVSWGTFLALKPFYIKSAATKDIEVCCYKNQICLY